MMPQLTDNGGMEIGYDSQLQVGDDGYYPPMALMPAKKPRLDSRLTDNTPQEEAHTSILR